MRSIAFWRRHFLGVEAAVALVPALALLGWFTLFDGVQELNSFFPDGRSNVYRTLATIAGTLLGFSMAVVSLVLNSASSRRFELLRRSPHYPSLWKTFFQTIRILGMLTLTSLACLILDQGGTSWIWVVIPCAFFVALSAARILRVIWILEQIISIAATTSPSDSDG